MALPVVGTGGLHLSRLSPKVRSIIKQRTAAGARRKNEPIIRNDRRAFGTANRAYRTEAGSVRGAIGMTESALNQARRGALGSGLSGSYLHQVLNELNSQQIDTARSAPLLLADAAATRASDIQKARTTLLTDRAQMQSDAGAKFSSALDKARTSAASTLKAAATSNQSSAADIRKLHNAGIAFQDAITNWSKNLPVKVNGQDVPVQQVFPLNTNADWRTFAIQIRKHNTGFDLVDAVKVVNAYRRRRQQQIGQVAAGHGQVSANALQSFPVFNAK
jgi:hypothetical protein